jgi:hypothetical protein
MCINRISALRLFPPEKSSIHVTALQQFHIVLNPTIDISSGDEARMKLNFIASWMVRLVFWK